MKTYAVYEIRDQEKLKLVKIDVVKAMTQESARRKAIIGTNGCNSLSNVIFL